MARPRAIECTLACGALLAACSGAVPRHEPRRAHPAAQPAAGVEPTGAPELAVERAEPSTALQPGLAAPASAPAGARQGLAAEGCGPFECWRFETGAAALAIVLGDGPLALGVGEAHALAGSESVTSTARRFSDELLPSLAAGTSHLVVELLNPDPRCERATREVRKQQQPVTAPQSTHNQNDYVELGHRARALGIEPFVLSPSCDEFRAIAGAGDAAIDVMLQTIARVTSRMLRGALAKNHSAGHPKLVIGYGGALHNDILPAPAKASWSYGPDLDSFTQGRYVELDLVVREFIKDSEVWRALPWYQHFDPQRFPAEWFLMRTAPRRYALFFPRDGASPAAPGRPTPTP